MKYIVDTNVLLSSSLESLKNYDIVITSHVLREIEELELKRRNDKQLQYEIRKAKRAIDEMEFEVFDLKDYEFSLSKELNDDYVDNILLQVAYDNNYGIISNDRLLRLKCKQFGIKVELLEEDNSFTENKGFKEDYLTVDELKSLYQELEVNNYNLLINEYLIIYDDAVNDDLIVLDIFKWNGKYMESLPRDKNGEINANFKTMQFDKFRPKDAYQMIAVDSIFRNQITQLRGKAGSGKSKIALEASWHLIEREGTSEGYEKLVIFVNPTPARDAQELGFYSGDKLEKVMQSSVGAMLKSKFGDEYEVRRQIDIGKLDILPMVDIRGYETGGKKTILWILEAQNLTSDLMKMGLQRASENTKVIIDGDYYQQVDKDVYSTNNGMKRASEVFRGDSCYGEVELQNIYRSYIAMKADEM